MKLFRIASTALFTVILSATASAQEFPAMPEGISFVNDMAEVMKMDERDVLDIRLMEYYDSTHTIIMIVTIRDFSGINPENYAAGLLVSWGIGNVYGDKALMVVIKPRNESGPAFADIKPNLRMSESVSRETLADIADNVILPSLRKEKYYSALFQGTEAIKSALAGEYRRKSDGGINLPGNLNLLTIALSVLVIILLIRIFVRKTKKS